MVDNVEADARGRPAWMTASSRYYKWRVKTLPDIKNGSNGLLLTSVFPSLLVRRPMTMAVGNQTSPVT